MMLPLIPVVAIVAQAAAPAPVPTRGDLWQGARAGDTEAQVSARFPAAVTSADPSSLADGARCLLQIQPYAFAGHRHQVCFYFSKGGLVQVTLHLVDDLRGGAADAQFEATLALLRAANGPETGSTRRPFGVLTMYSAEWRRPDGRISLLLLRVRENEAVLNINYQLPRRGERPPSS